MEDEKCNKYLYFLLVALNAAPPQETTGVKK
jgi:hypothetical protein